MTPVETKVIIRKTILQRLGRNRSEEKATGLIMKGSWRSYLEEIRSPPFLTLTHWEDSISLLVNRTVSLEREAFRNAAEEHS